MYPMVLHGLALACFSSLIAPFGGFFASGFKRAFKIKVNHCQFSFPSVVQCLHCTYGFSEKYKNIFNMIGTPSSIEGYPRKGWNGIYHTWTGDSSSIKSLWIF